MSLLDVLLFDPQFQPQPALAFILLNFYYLLPPNDSDVIYSLLIELAAPFAPWTESLRVGPSFANACDNY